ncbi:hypothetical protein [Rummeliibacillus suwonensis]|uniref:hypothetical protein n=1 Tax=Rummeliibacillus suwonensis TaxID=1306154 RepID=UPI001AAF6E2F|nr:hypothetical protein [Rummeliibacillus suwonensis]MBO2534282.1 hypothetical protein [Rummeliibacillus suwonensis]
MRIKPFISMGLASMLIVPTLITAANPELAHAKTSSKASSKKISAKAKSVIYKIKAINPKKTNYISKTKAAVSAYNKLSKKDKKMVYNYSTLKKNWSKTKAYLKKIDNLNKKVAALNTKNYATKIAAIKKQYSSLNRVTKAAVPKTTVKKINYYANRKANLVIASIKAINPKKSDYIVKTKAAVSAYKKLSKTDKKKVTNYATLKKYWKNIQPYLKKIDTLNKNVSTLNSKNFPTKSVSLQKQFDSLNAATQAAVPSTTLKKLSYYSDVVSTNKLVLMSTGTTTPDGTKILAIINAYKKLSGAQQSLLKDLISDKEEAKANLARYLALEAIIKKAADIEKQYAALKSASKTYAQDLVALYKNYNTVKGDSIDYNETTYSVSNFVPDDGKITNMGAAYANEINKAQEFNDKIDQLEAGTLANPYETIKTDLPTYKVPSITVVASNYPKVAPIDLADKNAVATYKKYESVPDIIDGFKNVSLDPLNQLTWAGSGEETSKILLSSTKISKLADLLPQYNKLGANQKAIVQNKLAADSNNAKDYLSEGKNLTSAQAIDKSYESALKNKAKPSYFADLLKVNSAYEAATPEVKRFVVNAVKINGIPNLQEYKDAKTAVDNFTNAVNSIPSATDTTTANSAITAINGVVTQYNNVASKPSWLALVDKTVLKTYNDYAQVPDVLKLVANVPTTVQNPYTAKQITNITSATKAYKKLGTSQKQIVDIKYPSFADLVADESNITAAQKIDSAYLKLKKSSSTYPKEAKTVYQTYDDASDDVKTYVVYKNKIKDLLTTFTSEQNIANTFETKVNALSKKSKIADVESAVDYYNTYISTSPKVSSLVDKAVLKKYNDYAPVSNVVKLLSLIKESNVSSPSVTPTDVKYIQQSTIAYNALKTDPKMIIDDADRSKFPFLYDGKYITEAAAIDKAYEKVKPTDDQYEIEILDVYYQMYDRAPAVVQKYVANKAELDKIGTRYAPQLTIVRDFETKVRQMSHVSENGATPKIASVQSLEKYYFDNIKYNKINAKYNIPLSTLIDPEVMEEYRKYSLVLQIQDIAKTIYVLYGKLFNEENVEFDKVKDDFYCNDATGSLKDSSRCHPADYYDSSKKGYTDSGKRDGNPIKITNPNDIKLIYKAIDYFKQLDTPQIAILKKAPSSLNDTYYKDRYGGNNDPNTESGDVHPSIPMSMGEINNFLKAQEIDKEYEALSPSSKTYIQDAIALYYKFYKAGRPVQLYTVHEKDIKAFSTSYDTASLISGIESFINKVNLLSSTSLLTDVTGAVAQYNKLNEAQLSVLDQGVLTKYNVYAPIAEIKAIADTIPTSGTYSVANIDSMLKAIAIYKKLTKDPKAIVDNYIVPSKPFLNDETEIKAAQKVDKAFKALDKTDDKYVTKLKQVKKDYDALPSGAQKYVTSDITTAVNMAIYKTPSDAAKAFEKLIVGSSENDPNAWLNRDTIPYSTIKGAVDSYEALSSKAKSLVDSDVMKIYNKYAPIVTIVEALKNITPANMSIFPNDEASTGYYKTQYPNRDIGTEISNAIQLYNKLGTDQKDIVKNELEASYEALLNETNNIKAAQALDKKIEAIKPKSSSYVKGIIDAQKTLNVMPKEQRVYLQNADILAGYDKTGSQTAKAIDDLTKFEKGVQQVEQWTSEIQKDSSGNIIGTCSGTTDPCNTAITKKMTELKTLFDQLNTPRIVDGAETKLASLIDRAVLARYQYFREIYDVIDQL